MDIKNIIRRTMAFVAIVAISAAAAYGPDCGIETRHQWEMGYRLHRRPRELGQVGS